LSSYTQMVSASPDPRATPHTFPCRLVETVTAAGEGRSAVVLATADGMLTGPSAWPATLLTEAMAQSILLLDPPEDMAALRLVGLDDVRVLRAVTPGDRVEVAVEKVAVFGRLRRYRCTGRCGGAVAVTAQVTVSS
jgi:acyl dehydratase